MKWKVTGTSTFYLPYITYYTLTRKTADKNQTVFIVYGLSWHYRMHFRPIYQLTVVWKTKSENLYSTLDPSSTSNEFKVSMKY